MLVRAKLPGPLFSIRNKGIKLLIKGSKEEAREAADRHNIVLTSRFRIQQGEIMARCDDFNVEKVAWWYMEMAHLTAPYPIGTLLWYQF